MFQASVDESDKTVESEHVGWVQTATLQNEDNVGVQSEMFTNSPVIQSENTNFADAANRYVQAQFRFANPEMFQASVDESDKKVESEHVGWVQTATLQNEDNVGVQSEMFTNSPVIQSENTNFVDAANRHVQAQFRFANPEESENLQHANVQEEEEETRRDPHNLQWLFDNEHWPGFLQLINEFDRWLANSDMDRESEEWDQIIYYYHSIQQIVIDFIEDELQERRGPN